MRTVLFLVVLIVADAVASAASGGFLPVGTGVGWKDGWVAEWRSDVPGLDVRDTETRVSSNLVKVVRRWTWRGTAPLEKVVLSVRYRMTGDPADLKPFLPGVLMYGNPSNRGRTDGRVPVYDGQPCEMPLKVR